MDEIVRNALEEQHKLRIIRPMGRGGFAEVYEAESAQGVRCAVKVSLDRLDGSGRAMQNQAIQKELDNLQLVQTITGHPHVVTLMDYWVIGGCLVTRWELATEGSLADLLAQYVQAGMPGIPLDPLLRYIYDAADGIDFLNGQGIYHRDIKPENLLLFHGHVKLADLGLAKFAGASTASHTGSGTLGYLPPEAYEEHRLSKTVDLYSLAATYVKLRTGREPFGTSLHEVVKRQERGEPNAEGLEGWEIPLVRSALAGDPQKRFAAGARKWALALSRARPKQAPVTTPPRTVVEPAEVPAIYGPLARAPVSKKPALPRWTTVAIAGTLVLVVCLAVASLIPKAKPGQAQSPPDGLSPGSGTVASTDAQNIDAAHAPRLPPGAAVSGAAGQGARAVSTPEALGLPIDAAGRATQPGGVGDRTGGSPRQGSRIDNYEPTDGIGSRDSVPGWSEPLIRPPGSGFGSREADDGVPLGNAQGAGSVTFEVGPNTAGGGAGELEEPGASVPDAVRSRPNLSPPREDDGKNAPLPNEEPDAPQSPCATPEELEQAVAACGSDSERISLCTSVANDPLVSPDVAARAREWLEKLQRVLEADCLADEACELLAAGQAEAARKKLREANKLAPDRVRAVFLLGLLEALEFRNPEEAQRALKEALKRAPKHAAVLNNLAIIELRLDHVGQAINYFKLALAEAPGMGQAVNNLRRLAAYARRGAVKLKKRDIEAIEKFCDELGGPSLDASVGWLFVDLSAGGTESSGLRAAMNSSWQAWEDHVCVRCDGLGRIDCPNCAQGSVARVGDVTSPGLYDTQRGAAMRRELCGTCSGRGSLGCPFCFNGRD